MEAITKKTKIQLPTIPTQKESYYSNIIRLLIVVFRENEAPSQSVLNI